MQHAGSKRAKAPQQVANSKYKQQPKLKDAHKTRKR